MLSVPEGWWSGGCGVPALHLKRGERGRVPASRRAPRLFEKVANALASWREKKNLLRLEGALVLNGCHKYSRGSGGGFFTKLMMGN